MTPSLLLLTLLLGDSRGHAGGGRRRSAAAGRQALTGMTTTDLDLRGMSCAACAARVEGALNGLDGVHAAVNFALERAHVQHGSAVSAGDLIRAVESTGYQASVAADRPGLPEDLPHGNGCGCGWPARVLLAIPVVAVSMVMEWQFAGWQWLAFALTTPIVAWGGYPFHLAAARGARHGTSTMDTLVSLGTLAAYLWSATAVLRGTGPVYFEVAAAVTVFQLAGRYAEARAKRASGAALRSLLSLGAKDAAVLRDGDEVRVPVSAAAGRRRRWWCDRGSGSPPTA